MNRKDKYQTKLLLKYTKELDSKLDVRNIINSNIYLLEKKKYTMLWNMCFTTLKTSNEIKYYQNQILNKERIKNKYINNFYKINNHIEDKKIQLSFNDDNLYNLNFLFSVLPLSSTTTEIIDNSLDLRKNIQLNKNDQTDYYKKIVNINNEILNLLLFCVNKQSAFLKKNYINKYSNPVVSHVDGIIGNLKLLDLPLKKLKYKLNKINLNIDNIFKNIKKLEYDLAITLGNCHFKNYSIH